MPSFSTPPMWTRTGAPLGRMNSTLPDATPRPGEFTNDDQRPWRPDLLDCEGGAHPFLIMRLILIGVVDVADQGVIARLEV